MKRLWIKKLLLVLSSLAFCVICIFLLELCTRLIRPDINFQDTERSLLREKVFGETEGWQPNASGISFGTRATIDEFGFRKLASPDKPAASWLILGDSVTFGVGVADEEIYVQLLQNDLPTVKLWNTAMIGYNIKDYRNVLHHFTVARQNRPDIKRVILFFCLNDLDLGQRLEKGQGPSLGTPGFAAQIMSYLRRHSKFYMLAKNAMSDRSRVYFLNDLQLYKEDGEDFKLATNMLSEMQTFLQARGIDFTIVIPPYEYQLRTKDEKHLIPQKLLTAYFKEKGIAYIDAYEHFARFGGDVSQNFLYADFAHLSTNGHRLMYNLLKEKIKTE